MARFSTRFHVIGPAIVTAMGRQPILFPNIPFGIFGAVTSYLIVTRDAAGHPQFEAIAWPSRRAGTAKPTARSPEP